MSELFTTTIAAHQTKTVVVDTPGRYEVLLQGEYARVEIVGRFRLIDTQNQAYEVVIHHQAPHTSAQTKLLGVVDNRAFLQLKGKIIIDEHCHDSQSFLTERVLLLAPTAKAEVVPDLEILNHEVKCSHAASLSRVPDSQIFYLMSRGLAMEQAKQLITEGFLLQ